MAKIGRNDSCPCGSGKKFKKCHGAIRSGAEVKTRSIAAEVQALINRHQAKLIQKQAQQGLGRPIVSTELNGRRIVAVGNKLVHSSGWKTFHDFLFDYIKQALGPEWGNKEIAKPLEQRHPILQWYDALCRLQSAHGLGEGNIKSAPLTGAVAAYLGLAYNLYLLEHNVELQTRLVTRLKNHEQFHGAYYETFVAAAFIRAGFSIELENETDGDTTHCEFTAAHASGRKYSVEAKARHVVGVLGVVEGHGTEADQKLKVGHQLYAALKKKARSTRVVFIDVNVPDHITGAEEVGWLKEALGAIRSKESSMTIKGKPAPEAYVFLTNLPYHHAPESGDFRVAVLAEGFKIPDFKMDVQYSSLRDARIARDRHKDLFDLARVFANQKVPSTFDGEIPDFAFGNVEVPRLIIGQRYAIPDSDGTEKVGVLKDAVVMESEKLVCGIYDLGDGRSVMASTPMTETELQAYRDYPETFFGAQRSSGGEIKDALDLYDKLFEVYRNTEKEKLLTWMREFVDVSPYENLSQQEVAEIFCERHAESLFNQRKN